MSSESFLHLPEAERIAILTSDLVEPNLSPFILEKDVWVCWALDTLFSMPNRHHMAFKGGTSLSKIFNAISRFSEDVDITIDHKSLDPNADPFAQGLSGNAKKRISEALDQRTNDYIANIIAPHFKEAFDNLHLEGAGNIQVSNDILYIQYPSVLEDTQNYVQGSVKLEFGGKNAIVPNDEYVVTSILSKNFADITFPSATVSVLSAERTFWEKATLMHAECGRAAIRTQNRLSRHWYDLDQLAQSQIGQAAVTNKNLLADVIRLKKHFYNSSTANYDECNSGGFKLIPNQTNLPILENDYLEMTRAGMLYGVIPSFAEIISRLKTLENEINSLYPHN